MEKMAMETKNKTLERLEQLKELLPEVITETKDANGDIVSAIDAKKLEQLLSTKVIEGDESYDFTWVGKKQAMVEASRPIRKTLRPCKEESVDWEKTENLYIEGDNLDVLKLLQESYLNKIQIIYIDPPYNTGNDSFIYPDDYKTNKDQYDEEVGAIDESGYRMFKNTETNGRFHSSWCSMMYSRLKLARNLLSDDGAIFVSIDEHELPNLTKIMNEIFGATNYIDTIVWDKKSSAKGVPPKSMMVNVHEYIIVYQKNDNFKFEGEKRSEEKDGFKNPDNDPRGPWRESNIKSTTKPLEEAFTIINPNNGKEYTNTWAFSKESLEKMIKENRILWKETLPKQKEFMLEMTNENKAIKSSWGVFDAQSTTVFLKHLLPQVVFDNPKPINLMKYLISVATSANDIILDFFSGSATTAHAVMQLNAEDGGNRKFIMVQLPEICDEKSEAYKAGYTNICEIGKERIRRTGNKIKEETGKQDLDIGFRVLKLDESNMKDVYYAPSDYNQSMLDKMTSNIKEDRTPEDLLYACMLEWGLELSLPHETKEINGFNIHIVNDGDLIACFDDKVSEDVIKQIADMKPLRVVFRDSSFATDSARINVDEIFKLKSPNTNIKVL